MRLLPNSVAIINFLYSYLLFTSLIQCLPFILLFSPQLDWTCRIVFLGLGLIGGDIRYRAIFIFFLLLYFSHWSLFFSLVGILAYASNITILSTVLLSLYILLVDYSMIYSFLIIITGEFLLALAIIFLLTHCLNLLLINRAYQTFIFRTYRLSMDICNGRVESILPQMRSIFTWSTEAPLTVTQLALFEDIRQSWNKAKVIIDDNKIGIVLPHLLLFINHNILYYRSFIHLSVEENFNYTCPICYQSQKYWCKLICNHQYCLTCSYNWFIQNATCPLCRGIV